MYPFPTELTVQNLFLVKHIFDAHIAVWVIASIHRSHDKY